MSSVVTLRPFVPAKDFQSSQRFYEALGFTVTPLSEKIARVLLGKGRDTASFLLQDFYVKEWAENHMMQLVVADLDRWWQHIESLELDKRFGVGPPRPPKIGRAHDCTPVTNAHLVFRLLLEKKK